MTASYVPRRVLALALLIAGTFCGAAARAAGLTYLDPGPRALARAGAVTASVDDASAVVLNPARLALLPGSEVFAALTLVDLRQSFSRAGATSTGAPFNDVSQSGPVGLLPLVAARSDFGLDDWAFGLAVHAPNAYGRREFPSDGAQRYALVGTDLQLLFISAAVAWAPLPELSVGVSLDLVTLPRARISMVVDGYWLDTTHVDQGPYDTLATIDVKDPLRVTASVGLSWRPTGFLEIGLAARLLPVHIEATGRFTPEFLGDTISALHEGGELTVTDRGVSLGLTLPPVVRLGVRLVGHEETPDGLREWGDLELDVVYEAWSLYERLSVDFDGALRLASATNDLPLNALDLPRRYRDTWSVRLGGGLRPGLPWLRLFAGAFYESAAAGTETTTVDTATGHRLGFGVGVAVTLGPVEATVSYLHVFELPTDSPEGGSDIVQQRPASPCVRPYSDASLCNPVGLPSGPQVGAGRYQSDASLIAFGVRVGF